jgi:hypothetical protein
LIALGSLLLLSLAVAYGITMRYEVDFAAILVLSGLLVWYLLLDNGQLRRLVAGVGSAAIVYSSTVGAAISFTGYYDSLRTGNPGAYKTLQDVTSPIPTLATMIAGHPDIVRIIVPTAQYPENLGDFGTNSPGRSPFSITRGYDELDIVSPDSGSYRLSGAVLSTTDVTKEGEFMLFLDEPGRIAQFSLSPGTSRFNIPLHLNQGINRIEVGVVASLEHTPDDAAAIVDYLTLVRA